MELITTVKMFNTVGPSLLGNRVNYTKMRLIEITKKKRVEIERERGER